MRARDATLVSPAVSDAIVGLIHMPFARAAAASVESRYAACTSPSTPASSAARAAPRLIACAVTGRCAACDASTIGRSTVIGISTLSGAAYDTAGHDERQTFVRFAPASMF